MQPYPIKSKLPYLTWICCWAFSAYLHQLLSVKWNQAVSFCLGSSDVQSAALTVPCSEYVQFPCCSEYEQSLAVQNMCSPVLFSSEIGQPVLFSVSVLSSSIQSTSPFLFSSVLSHAVHFGDCIYRLPVLLLCSVLPHCCSGVRWSASSFFLFRSASLLFTYDGQPVLLLCSVLHHCCSLMMVNQFFFSVPFWPPYLLRFSRDCLKRTMDDTLLTTKPI